MSKSEIKFVSLCAELYVDTASRGWQKCKTAETSQFQRFPLLVRLKLFALYKKFHKTKKQKVYKTNFVCTVLAAFSTSERKPIARLPLPFCFYVVLLETYFTLILTDFNLPFVANT